MQKVKLKTALSLSPFLEKYLEVEFDVDARDATLGVGAGSGDPSGDEDVVPVAGIPVDDDGALAALGAPHPQLPRPHPAVARGAEDVEVRPRPLRGVRVVRGRRLGHGPGLLFGRQLWGRGKGTFKATGRKSHHL